MTFADQDDYCLPDAFASAYELYKENKCDLICFNKKDFHKCHSFYKISDNTLPYIIKLENTNQIKLFLSVSTTVVWGKYYKTSLLKNNDVIFIANSYREEIPFILPSIALSEKILIVEKEVYQHIDNKSSASYNTNTGMSAPNHAFDIEKAIIQLVNWFLNHQGLYETFHEEVEFFCVWHLLMIPLINDMLINDYIIAKHVQTTVNDWFPDWHENPYFKAIRDPQFMVDTLTCLEAIMTPVTEENYEEYVKLIKMIKKLP